MNAQDKVVLFDLDGTLVDTAHDLGLALNMQLTRHDKATLPHHLIRPVASHGTTGLLALGFGLTLQDVNFAKMRAEFLDLYASVFTRHPQFLPGIAELLNVLTARGVRWGIVTNKPRRFSVDLIKAVNMGESNLFSQSSCLICGDDAPQPKPAPDTLLMATKLMQTLAHQCIYVGDAERDVKAGKAAGMKTVVALFGYIADADRPAEWGADKLIMHPLELLECLN